jgi:hypothetical protein
LMLWILPDVVCGLLSLSKDVGYLKKSVDIS